MLSMEISYQYFVMRERENKKNPRTQTQTIIRSQRRNIRYPGTIITSDDLILSDGSETVAASSENTAEWIL